MAEARTTKQIWEARVCLADAHGGWGFSPSCEGIKTIYGGGGKVGEKGKEEGRGRWDGRGWEKGMISDIEKFG